MITIAMPRVFTSKMNGMLYHLHKFLLKESRKSEQMTEAYMQKANEIFSMDGKSIILYILFGSIFSFRFIK